MTLKNVLHVPKLSTNLVSIQKLSQDLSYNMVFYSDCCVFQDKGSGRTIRHAKERDSLYYLEMPRQLAESRVLMSATSLSNKEKIPLYHRRLGHLV